MYTVENIFDIVETLAPKTLAMEWDNVGVLVNCKNSVSKILVSLDITVEVINEAVSKKCDLIVSHHPVIFSPIKRISADDVVFKLIQNNISAICAHTNLDSAVGGVNDALAEVFALENTVEFADMGRVGTLKKELTCQELATLCSEKLGGKASYIDSGKTIKTLAVLGGAGAEIDEAISMGADALITGEVKHHEGIYAKQIGFCVVNGGHHNTEFPVVNKLCAYINSKVNGIEVITSSENKDPFEYVD